MKVRSHMNLMSIYVTIIPHTNDDILGLASYFDDIEYSYDSSIGVMSITSRGPAGLEMDEWELILESVSYKLNNVAEVSISLVLMFICMN